MLQKVSTYAFESLVAKVFSALTNSPKHQRIVRGLTLMEQSQEKMLHTFGFESSIDITEQLMQLCLHSIDPGIRVHSFN